MPEIKYTPRVRLQIARSKHDIGFVLQHRPEENVIFLGVIFHVGVLNTDEIACRMRKSGAKRGALAAIFLVVQHGDFGMILCEFTRDHEALIG
jgi:hypothetical protein